MEDKLIKWAADLQSIAQAGLFYGHDNFDKERYQIIREIACEMLAEKVEINKEKVKDLFCADSGYQTPKVDTRSAIFKDNKILLVQERNGKWALPGGWCEYNMSPCDNAIKETLEEAGLNVKVSNLIAVLDRDKHNTPKYVYNVTKIFYLCEVIDGSFKENIETLNSAYFTIDELPSLACEKTNFEQIKMCFDFLKNKEVKFD